MMRGSGAHTHTSSDCETGAAGQGRRRWGALGTRRGAGAEGGPLSASGGGPAKIARPSHPLG